MTDISKGKIEWKYTFCGIEGQSIDRDIIPYKGELNDRDILCSSTGKDIMYFESEKGFIIITDDPCHNLLDENDIYSEWTKYPKHNMIYCIEKALEAGNK